MGMFLPWATWAHEYIDIFVNVVNTTWGRFNHFSMTGRISDCGGCEATVRQAKFSALAMFTI